MQVYGDRIPMMMLQEHYRCHPQIIRFCNEKFYENNLVIMTEGSDEDEVLSVVRTAPGNHERQHPDGGFINVRQMEVIRDEVLPALEFEALHGSHIGDLIKYIEYTGNGNSMLQSSKEPLLVVEVDGYQYHKKGTEQFDRDRLKDRILEIAGIKMMRFMTNGRSEKERLIEGVQQHLVR